MSFPHLFTHAPHSLSLAPWKCARFPAWKTELSSCLSFLTSPRKASVPLGPPQTSNLHNVGDALPEDINCGGRSTYNAGGLESQKSDV